LSNTHKKRVVFINIGTWEKSKIIITKLLCYSISDRNNLLIVQLFKIQVVIYI